MGKTELFVWPERELFISIFFVVFYNVLRKSALTSNHERDVSYFSEFEKLIQP